MGGTQKDMLEIMRQLSAFIQDDLPKTGASLMGPPVDHFLDMVPPGKVVYFGIEYILNLCPYLFNPKSLTAKLTEGIDGLPLFRSSNVGVWPTPGRMTNRKPFLTGFYTGAREPRCSNLFFIK